MRPASAAAAILVCAGACGEQEASALGGVVRLHGEDDFCAGTHQRLAAEVGRIESEVGLDFLGPVDVHLYRVDELCSNANVAIDVMGAGGCALDGQTVAAESGSISHELVHALRFQHGIRGNPLFEEGIASAVGNGHPSHAWTVNKSDFTPRPLASSAMLDWSDYATGDARFGAHFTSWALEDETRRSHLQAFLASDYTADLATEFELAFGRSLSEVESDWALTSKEAYFSSGRCTGVEIVDLASGPIQVDGFAACDDSGTEGTRDALLLAGKSCFRLNETAFVKLSSQAESGTLLLMPVDCAEGVSSALAGETKEVPLLGGCTWAAAFTTQGEELDSFSYQLELVVPE